MAKINQMLLERLQTKLGLGRSQVYKLIDAKVRSASLPRNLAALAVAAETGINISRFASGEDLSTIRQSAIYAAPAPVVLQTHNIHDISATRSSAKVKRSTRIQTRRGTTVFVVHGRNLAVRDAVFSFLRAVGLKPLEWTHALKLTSKGSPYVGEVLDAAFSKAAAVVVFAARRAPNE